MIMPDADASSLSPAIAYDDDGGIAYDPSAPATSPYCSIAISTTFHPAFSFHDFLPDAIFLTSDAVYFFVHRALLAASSTNGFGSPLVQRKLDPAEPPIFLVPEDSVAFDVVLNDVYDLPPTCHAPSLSSLLDAIPSLQSYGIALDPSSPLYQHILAESPRAPLSVYTAAAQYRLDALAVAVSPQLLSLALTGISDSAMCAMGSFYLRRLFMLHHYRIEYLKQLLQSMPETHAETVECGFVEQRNLENAWMLATASLLWDARPDAYIVHAAGRSGVDADDTLPRLVYRESSFDAELSSGQARM
ncbi:hypothetical protein EIP91_002529 [Steccherinum ochraceum]|uniref:BTB domain-containing protein n=1 Tax=Steccherinum ochraceum TaxID=92696 RepID=A0A4R0RC21_9APHY|nr:hypothetical protein EIP91_002529 [Steccherinum ochraceum]